MSYPKDDGPSDEILYKLCDLGVRSFGSGMTHDEVREHILDADTLFVAYERDKPVGFAGIVEQTDTSFYFSAAVVDPEKRKSGLYKELTRLRLDMAISEGGKDINTRTQNPIVEKTIQDILEDMIAVGKINGYSVSHSYKPAVFGRLLTNDIPKSGNQRLDEAYSTLDYTRGDAFLINFSLSLPVGRRYTGGCLW